MGRSGSSVKIEDGPNEAPKKYRGSVVIVVEDGVVG